MRADNPGPFTLTGTNTWIVGSDPAWLVDPGPDLHAHAAAVIAEVERRGGLGGIALTHDHSDHSGAVAAVRRAVSRMRRWRRRAATSTGCCATGASSGRCRR